MICKSPSAINFFSLYSSLESRAFRVGRARASADKRRSNRLSQSSPVAQCGLYELARHSTREPRFTREKLHIHKVYFLCLNFSLLNEDVDNTTNEIFSVSSEEDSVCCVITTIFLVVNSGKHSLSSVNFSFGEHTKAKRLKIYLRFVILIERERERPTEPKPSETRRMWHIIKSS